MWSKGWKFQTRSKLLALGKAFLTCNIQFLLRGTEYSGCPSEVKFLAIPKLTSAWPTSGPGSE